MKIAILDFDHSHNLRLQTSLKGMPKLSLAFCQQVTELLEILNPNQALDAKLERMNKTLVDGSAMLQKTVDGIEKAKASIAEKRTQVSQLTTVAQAPQKEILNKEIEALNAQINNSEELKRKIEVALAARKNEIEALKAKGVAEDDKKVDLILVDRSFLGNLPSDWLIELRTKIEFADNKEVPVITMGYNEEMNYIRNTLHGGIQDYFVKPVDLLLLKFNLNKLLGLGDPNDGKIFELQTKTEIKILKIATILKMSEFELNIAVDSTFAVGELIEFHTDVFDGKTAGRVLAKCLKCEADPSRKGWFTAVFSLVGHTPATMTEMRKWLRLQYIASKKEG